MTSHLEVRDVSVRYPTRDGGTIKALERVDLDLRGGDFVVALGASGCGKTTLLNLLGGFIRPSEGVVKLNDRSIDGPGADRGVVFQKHALLPWLSVRDNVCFGLKLRGLSKKERYEKAEQALNLVELKGFEDHFIYELSGGMQQRVGLARALTSDPEILLMDEPLGALDALTRENMQELILKVWSETHKMIFFITHSVEEALFMATRLVVMSPRPGRVSYQWDLDFSRRFLENKESARVIKSSSGFVQKREEVLKIIYGDEKAAANRAIL